MKLSIVIACYNIEAYIERCLRSILPQLSGDVEVVVINDGSTDRSREILCGLAKEHDGMFRVVDFPNGGLATARNRGLELTTGEFLWFIDGDDFIENEAIPILLDTISDGGADIIAFNHSVKTATGICDVRNYNDRFMTGSEFLSTGSRLFAWNKVYRRGLFDDFRFQDGLRNIEDFVFNLSVSPCVKSVRTISQSLYVYERTNVGSISMDRSPRHLIQLSQETFRAHEILRNRYVQVEDPDLKSVWRRLLTTSYAGHIYSLLRFYNCRMVKRAIGIYKEWGVYPFPYSGNRRETVFSFFVNHPILWPAYKVLKRFMP